MANDRFGLLNHRPLDIATGNLPPRKPITGTPTAQLEVPVGWARLTAEDNPRLSVLVPFAGNGPENTDGGPTWIVTDLPQRLQQSDWRGNRLAARTLDLWPEDPARESIERTIQILQAFTGEGKLATPGRPPLLIVDTAGVMDFDAREYPNVRWYVDGLPTYSSVEGEVQRNAAGNRWSQRLTLPIRVHNADTDLTTSAQRVRESIAALTKDKGATKTYVAKDGQTLLDIAAQVLKDPGRWTVLADLNGIHDPRSIKAGARIKYPAR